MIRTILQFALLAALAFGVHARDFSYKGTKPQAIIDVRTPAEFAAGHVDGAINIPLEVIGQQITSLKDLKKDSTIVLYCRSGKRSEAARATLAGQGYTKVVNAGGLDDISKALQPCPAAGC